MSDLPAQIGRYDVERLLGEGGMGVLYLAADPVLARPVALKLLRVDSADLRRRFMREAQSAARIQHPNIVTIYDVGEHDGQLYIAMEYIDGDTLASLIRDDVPFSPIRKLDVIDDVADGLAFAHQRGIVHRDIKPANLMITRSGLVKVLDFGIARAVQAAHSIEMDGPTLVGTPAYMAPEVLEGSPADARADIYAVGLVTYELLSGRRAFAGATTADVLELVLAARPTPLLDLVPELDPDLAAIVSKAMARRPEDRYQDLQAFRKDLARARRRAMAASSDDATLVVGLPAPIRPQAPPPSTALDETKFAPAADDGPVPVPLPPLPAGLPKGSPSHSAGRVTVDADLRAAAPVPLATPAPPPVTATTAPPPATRRGVPLAAVLGGLVVLLGVAVVMAFFVVRALGLAGGSPATTDPPPAQVEALARPDDAPASSRESTTDGPGNVAIPQSEVAAEGGATEVSLPPDSTGAGQQGRQAARQEPVTREAEVPRVVRPPTSRPEVSDSRERRVDVEGPPAVVREEPVRRDVEPPAVAPREEALALVRGYVAARNTSHASGIRRVWPDVDDVHIRRVTSAFSAPLTLASCDVSVVDRAKAAATCHLTQPGTTGAYAAGHALTIRRTFVFDLARQGRNWFIVGLRE